MKMNRQWGWLFVVLLVMPLSNAKAGDLADKQKQTAAEKDIKKDIKAVNDKCGTAMTATLDFPSFKNSDPKGEYGIAGSCDAAMAGLRNLCDTDDGKAAVKGKVKKVVCSYGGSGKRSAALSGGTLTYKLDWEAANSADFVTNYLKSNL
jgi:hypothetical protein